MFSELEKRHLLGDPNGNCVVYLYEVEKEKLSMESMEKEDALQRQEEKK